MIVDSNDETNFPHKLLSANTQVSGLHKAFVSGSSANIKLSKTQLSKMVQLEGFLGILDTLNQYILEGPAVLAQKLLKNRDNIFFGLDKVLNVSNKARKLLTSPKNPKITGSEITLTKNEIRYYKSNKVFRK